LHGVVALLGFSRRNVADGFEQPPVIEPVGPFECGELDGFEGAPGSTSMDDFRFIETVDRLGESVVVQSPTLPADSTGRRNTFHILASKELVECFGRCFPSESFSRPSVDGVSDGIKLFWSVPY
jgi:hypothetical protein